MTTSLQIFGKANATPASLGLAFLSFASMFNIGQALDCIPCDYSDICKSEHVINVIQESYNALLRH